MGQFCTSYTADKEMRSEIAAEKREKKEKVMDLPEAVVNAVVLCITCCASHDRKRCSSCPNTPCPRITEVN